MKAIFQKKKITSIVGVLPETVSYFDNEVHNYTFPVKQTMRLKHVMGFESHRLVKEATCSSDLCLWGVKHLLEHHILDKSDIGAIIVVTLSPDYFLPQISNIIQGELNLSTDVLCMDIAQGCCGFLIGLMQAFLLLDQLKNKKVVLCNVDTLSKKVSKKDRNDFPLIGDGAAISIVENVDHESEIYYSMNMDGTRRDALKIPAGGFKIPSSYETGMLKDMGDGNWRALDHIHMDGAEVFSFVQNEVPYCIEEILQDANLLKDDIEYFFFHQPNTFMLKKLREKLNICEEKMPSDLVKKYGNPSGVSIPMVICDSLGDKLKYNKYRCCLSAFGSGLAWGAMTMELGNLDYCVLLESDL